VGKATKYGEPVGLRSDQSLPQTVVFGRKSAGKSGRQARVPVVVVMKRREEKSAETPLTVTTTVTVTGFDPRKLFT